MGANAVSALVFDMDGTLIESHAAVPDAYIACVRRRGGPACDRPQIIDAYGLGPPETILTHLLGRACSSR